VPQCQPSQREHIEKHHAALLIQYRLSCIGWLVGVCRTHDQA
jgi:hypothetical protein